MNATETVSALHFEPLVALGLTCSAFISLVGPLLLAVLIRKKTQAPWAALGVGALTFTVFQLVLRLPWQIAIGVRFKEDFAADPTLMMGWLVISCLTAGLFEETGRFLAFRKVLTREHSWRVGMMFGAGHGGIESILLVGINMAVSVVLYMLMTRQTPLPLPADAHAALIKQFSGLTFPLSLMGGVERVSSMCLHLALSLAVLRAVSTRTLGWYFGAMGFHALSNCVGVLVTRSAGPFMGEIAIGLCGVVSLVFIRSEYRRYSLSAAHIN